MRFVTYQKYDDITLIQMQQLWEHAPELTAARIAERFADMTKNTVIGQAHRRGWQPRRKRYEPSTVYTRCDALDAVLDAVLAETRPHVEGRTKLIIADPALVGVTV
jgi:hypothetical protein